MGKGLGDLQKHILVLAYIKHRKQGIDFVSARDVLIDYYRFPTNRNINHVRNGASFFSKELIGAKRYMSASVTVAQCFNRLTAAGLATRNYGIGIKLTHHGANIAKSLFLNKR